MTDGRGSRAARLAAVGVALLVGLACGEEPAPEAPVARPVRILEIGGPGVAGDLEFPGKIAAVQNAELAFEVPGRIVEFPVAEGQQVEEGALLARLDPRDYDLEVEKQVAQAEKARADFERYQKLYEAGVTPQADFEARQRNYEVAVANLRQAQKAAEDAALRAPFDGVVARKLVEDFANVQAKQPVVVVQDTSSLEVQVDVPEVIFARGQKGLTSEEITRRIRPRVIVSSLPDRVFEARLTELSTSADPETRTFQATFVFAEPPDANVLPGMTARVIATPARPEGGGGPISVPAAAVAADADGTPYVWKVDPETLTVSRAIVEVGELSASEIEIVSGLAPGDQIAASGVSQLREGVAVRRLE